MKRIQAIGILAFLFTLVGCDKYNDELLTDVEVEEYGYMELKSMMDDVYPLSSSLYTHSLNFYFPLVVTNPPEEKFGYFRIKGFLYNDVLEEDIQQKRIKVTQLEKLNSNVPYTLLHPIDYFPFMETGETCIVKTQTALDSILKEVKENPKKYLYNPSNLQQWNNIDFDNYYVLLIRECVEDYTLSSYRDGNSEIYNLVKHFLFEENGTLTYFISAPLYVWYNFTIYEDNRYSSRSCLIGVVINKKYGYVQNTIIRHRNYGEQKVY